MTYDRCNEVAARSLVMLRPFLEEMQDRYVLTNKGRLAKHLQATVGDLLFNDRSGGIWSVELKAEEKWTGNLFIETWSNRNLDNLSNGLEIGRKVGWFYTLNADLLFYHFVDSDKLVICRLPELQQWGFCHTSKNWSQPINGSNDKVRLQGRIFDFIEKKQNKTMQKNDTWGRLVPVSLLQKEVRPAPRIFSVRQLTLDLFGSEATWSSPA